MTSWAESNQRSASPFDGYLLPCNFQTAGLAGAAHTHLKLKLPAHFLAASYADQRVGNDLQALRWDFNSTDSAAFTLCLHIFCFLVRRENGAEFLPRSSRSAGAPLRIDTSVGKCKHIRIAYKDRRLAALCGVVFLNPVRKTKRCMAGCLETSSWRSANLRPWSRITVEPDSFRLKAEPAIPCQNQPEVVQRKR